MRSEDKRMKPILKSASVIVLVAVVVLREATGGKR